MDVRGVRAGGGGHAGGARLRSALRMRACRVHACACLRACVRGTSGARGRVPARALVGAARPCGRLCVPCLCVRLATRRPSAPLRLPPSPTQLTTATKSAFLNQLCMLITPALVWLSCHDVAPMEWLACGLGLLGSLLVAMDGMQKGRSKEEDGREGREDREGRGRDAHGGWGEREARSARALLAKRDWEPPAKDPVRACVRACAVRVHECVPCVLMQAAPALLQPLLQQQPSTRGRCACRAPSPPPFSSPACGAPPRSHAPAAPAGPAPPPGPRWATRCWAWC